MLSEFSISIGAKLEQPWQPSTASDRHGFELMRFLTLYSFATPADKAAFIAAVERRVAAWWRLPVRAPIDPIRVSNDPSKRTVKVIHER